MKLHKIILENIGAYRGVNTFDFSVDSSSKNLILIGGENGAGKTTLLNSIKLGLFGSYAFQFKTVNDAYFNKIRDNLNSTVLKTNNGKFRIILEFSEVENFMTQSYTFYRTWEQHNDKLKESVAIIKDGYHLSPHEQELFQSKLRETMPVELFDLCLFDGEEISKIISKDLLSNYLKDLSRVVFNLNLFENLESDLAKYLTQDYDQNALSGQERELLNAQHEKEIVEQRIDKITTRINELTEQEIALFGEIEQLKNEFNTHGGLLKEERDKLSQQVNAIENQRKANSDNIKEFISIYLPFYMNRNLLNETVTQMQKEESYQLFDAFKSKLSLEFMHNITDKLQGLDHANKDFIASQLHETILINLEPEQVKSIHRASSSQRSSVIALEEKIEKENHKKYVNLLQENKKLLEAAQEIRKQINTHDSTSEFKDLLSHIGKLNAELAVVQHQMEEQQILLEKELATAKEMEDQISKLQHAIKNLDKTKNTFSLSQNIMNLSKKFRRIQLQKQLQQVQIDAAHMLNRLMRKQRYISHIEVNHQTFEVNLYDGNNELIEKTTLSAGEKELLLLSLVWAIFKASEHRMPFVFDTLLGRLDRTHKKSVLLELIPAFGEQVIILSTDSEVDAIHYQLIKEWISHEYMLDFNSTEQKVDIRNHYFQFQEAGVVK